MTGNPTRSASNRTRTLWLATLTLLAIVIVAFHFVLEHRGKKPTVVVPSSGWSVSVLHANLRGVDNLQIDAGGAIYASLEPESQVVKLSGSSREVVAQGVKNADGLHYDGARYLYVTEEAEDGRVMRIDLQTRELTVIRSFNNPEGIAQMANGDLVVSEDRLGGRVVRLSMADGSTKVLARDLMRPEGLVVDSEDRIYIAETTRGRVLRLDGTNLVTLVGGLENPDQVALSPDGTLWVAEDAKPGRILKVTDGVAEVVASGLWAPQGIAFSGEDVLVAEQGRGQILKFSRVEN